MRHNNFNKEGNITTDVNRRISSLEQMARQKPSRVPIGGASASGDSLIDKSLTQTAHGFGVGTVVYFNGTTYIQAKADQASTAVYLGVVTKVTDANTFDLTYAGIATTTLTLTAGGVYYLSDTTAGAVLAANTPPTQTAFQVAVYEAISATEIYVYPGRPIGSSHLALHAGDPTNYGGTLRVYYTTNCYADVAVPGLSINQLISSVLTSTIITPSLISVGASPAVPTALGSLSVSGLSVMESSVVVCQFTSTLATMTLSATNSLSLAASDVTDTSQAIKFRKVSICDPTSGLVKNTWLPCSAPF